MAEPPPIAPNAGPEPGPSAAPHELVGDLRELVATIGRGWRLVAIVLAVCLALALVFLARAERRYLATARLLVLQHGGRPLRVGLSDPDNGSAREDELPTHIQVLASPMVVGRAVVAEGLDRLPWLKAQAAASPHGDPALAAIGHLKVSRPDRLADILTVQYQAGSRDEAVRTLRAVLASYRRFLDEKFRERSGEVVGLITRARDELRGELADLERKYQEIRRKTVGLELDDSGRTYLAGRLARWNEAADAAAVKAEQLSAQLELGRKLADEGAELWAVSHAIGQLGGDTSSLVSAVGAEAALGGVAPYIRALRQQQQELIDRHGAGNAKVVELQERIDRLQASGREAGGRLGGGASRELLASIEQSLGAVKAMRAQLVARFEQDRGEAQALEGELLEEDRLRKSLERQQSLFDTVVDQLKQAQFVSGYADVTADELEAAAAPPQPVSPRVGLTLAVALLAGGLIGTGAVVVADRLDPRIRSREGLRRALNLPVLGQLPKGEPGRASAPSAMGLACRDAPRSAWAEAFRAVRTHVDFLRRGGRMQVLLVTSPYPGDGKSTVASNLAISLAQAGRRVLLIDADLRKPGLHRLHDLDRSRGLVDLLRGRAALAEVARPTGIENLDLVATGADVPNPAELLTSPRLAEVLDEARRAYDLVLVDSSPLLAVADPAIISPSADGVVLVVRAAELRLDDARQATEALRAVGARVVGVVINAVGRDAYGYRFNYGYGYGQGEQDAGGDTPPDPDGSGPFAPQGPSGVNGKAGEPAPLA